MQISKQTLSEYNRRIDALANASADMALKAYDKYRSANPTASISDIRMAVIDILESCINAYGDAISTVAGQFCEEIAAEHGEKITTVYPEESGQGTKAIIDGTRYIVRAITPEREDI